MRSVRLMLKPLQEEEEPRLRLQICYLLIALQALLQLSHLPKCLLLMLTCSMTSLEVDHQVKLLLRCHNSLFSWDPNSLH